MKRKYNRRLTYRNKLIFISISTVICLISLITFDQLAKELQRKELNDVNLWSLAMTKVSDRPFRDYHADFIQLQEEVLSKKNSIPSIITDENLNIRQYTNIPAKVASNPVLLRRAIEKMASRNDPIEVITYTGARFYVFYDRSYIISLLRYFPFITLAVIVVFIALSYITYNSSKRDEQNKVWIGMAKETAHQLGTPTSSLLGWLDFLKTQDIDQTVVEEMNKDIERLLTVVDRFSKIGSKTNLETINATEVVKNTVQYFMTRVPKKVKLSFVAKEDIPMAVNANEVLFGWVIENLLRNAIDALQGAGKIDIVIYSDKKWVYVDVIDTGKGIAPANIERIFKPGFTTKARGWGLGLSLSYRIIHEYHKGQIYVAESAIDKGTTVRIMIKKV